MQTFGISYHLHSAWQRKKERNKQTNKIKQRS